MEREKTIKPFNETDDIFLSYNKTRLSEISGSVVFFMLISGFAIPLIFIILLLSKPFSSASFILIFLIIMFIYFAIHAMTNARMKKDYLKEKELILDALQPIVASHIKLYGNDVTIRNKGYYTVRKKINSPKEAPVSREIRLTNRAAYFELSNFKTLNYYVYEVPNFIPGNKSRQRRLRIAVEGNTVYQIK